MHPRLPHDTVLWVQGQSDNAFIPAEQRQFEILACFHLIIKHRQTDRKRELLTPMTLRILFGFVCFIRQCTVSGCNGQDTLPQSLRVIYAAAKVR